MYAYRAGFSTTDAILSLQTFIDNANHTGRKLVIINWDVSAAFDKCSRLLVIECLKILGCSDFLLEAFSKMPTGAVARICVNLAESRFPGISAPYACPQGQNSSGQLFGIGLFSLLLRLNNSDISSYKIDLCIQKDISPVEAFTEIQWKLDGNTALCSPPNVNSSIRDLRQISTTALIFMKTNYFRQDIWINIWIQFHFQYIFEGRDDFIHTRHIIVPPQIDCCKLDPSKKHKTCGDELNTIL